VHVRAGKHLCDEVCGEGRDVADNPFLFNECEISKLNEEKRRLGRLLDIRGFCRYGPWVKDRSKRGLSGSKRQQLRKQNHLSFV